MKKVKVEIINGVVTPKKPVISKGFGTMFDGKEYLIFESKSESDANVPVILDGEKTTHVLLTDYQLSKLMELLK